jgi:hypothetical protein
VFNEKQFMTNFSSIFVTLAPNPIVLERLMKVHNKRVEGKKIAINFEVYLI